MKKIILQLVMPMLLLVPCSFAAAQTDATGNAFSQSYAAEAKGEYAKAVTTMKGVYDAKNYEVNLRLGWLCYEAGQYTESQSYYQAAISLMPYGVEPRLGFVYPASALGNWDKVITQYQEILKVDASNTTANYRLGLIYYNRKEYQKAFPYFEKLVNLYPFGYDALLMFAWTNFQLGKTKEAKLLFTKVLWYAPTDKSALEGLSLIK